MEKRNRVGGGGGGGGCRLAQRSLRLGAGLWIRGKLPLTRAGGGSGDDDGGMFWDAAS